jgi:tetratricopeptide (TPR) repeat protein
LQSDFNVHLIAGVLEAKTIDLMEPWQELEHARLFQGNGFSHDLIYETVQEGISSLLKTFLHRRAAEVLTEMKANPARIAKHWLEAGEALQAAPALLQAATQADFASRVSEATQFAEQAVTIYAQNGDKEKEFDALAQLSRFIQGAGDNERLGQLSSRLLAKASTPEMRGKAFNERAWYLYRVGKLEESLRAVEQGLEHLQTTNNLYYQAELKQLESQLSLRLGFAERAARALAEMRVLAEKLGDPEAIIAAIIEQGRLVASQDKHREALHLYKEALAAMKEWGQMSYGQVAVLSLCAEAEKTLGNSEAALEYVREAWRLNERYSAGAHVQAGLLLTEAGVYRVTGNYPDALALTERAIELDKNGLWGQQARCARAEMLLEMGEVSKATKELEHLLAQELEPSVRSKCERALSKLVKA